MKKANFIVLIITIIGVLLALIVLITETRLFYKDSDSKKYIHYDEALVGTDDEIKNKYVEINFLDPAELAEEVKVGDIIATGLKEAPTLEIVKSILGKNYTTESGVVFADIEIIGTAEKTNNILFIVTAFLIYNKITFYIVVSVLGAISIYGLGLLFFWVKKREGKKTQK